MGYKFRTLAVALLAATTMLPSVKADEWNKESTVTFTAPVQIPSQVLSPGTYVFKLADSQSDRHIVVQIFREDQSELVATIEAIPAYRLEPTGVTLITFEERPTGTPEAVKRCSIREIRLAWRLCIQTISNSGASGSQAFALP